LVPMLFSMSEPVLDKLGIMSKRAKIVQKSLDAGRAHGMTIVDDFIERRKEGKLTEFEEKCYLNKVLEQDSDNVAIKEMMLILLMASVDTTSAIINWNLVHLALRPDIQEKLHGEIKRELKGGQITEEFITSAGRGNWLPYLHAIVREAHRVTPALSLSIMKEIDKDMEIKGYRIPAKSTVCLATFAPHNDPAVFPDTDVFRPERWLPDEVKARVGTASEFIDHTLYKSPFSAGARMCPGSRTANLEVMCILSQLVQDWKIGIKGEQYNTYHDITYTQGTTIQPNMPEFTFEPRT